MGEFKFNVGDTVKVTGGNYALRDHEGKTLKVEKVVKSTVNENFNEYYLEGIQYQFYESELELVTQTTNEAGYFETKATELGKLVDTKQNAYGDSFSKAFDLMKIYLQNYKNEQDNTYTIPESLLQHILLQVRIIDKQNRIFSNPDGDLMQENPYADVGGYSLLGMKMCEPNS
ncbi:hypothetical protein WKH56_19790 [Priestia sp. SB1]|uniref:hypothetical protein n=1 Tax=Priestia sp. SB1 TaxID=3132359 RepID=UPI0031823216